MNETSQIFSKYLADKEISRIFSDEALIKKILAFEIALAKEQAYLDIIPKTASEEISSLLSSIVVDPRELADGTRQHGVPVVPLLELVKSKIAANKAKFIHYGATSQDAMDTALALMLKDATKIISEKLALVISNLKRLTLKYGNTPCMARTRGQLAMPTLFQHKIIAWLEPLQRQSDRLKYVEDSALKIQLGGAVGDLAFYKEKGDSLRKAVAAALDLHLSPSWHSQRDGLSELTNWMAITSGVLGKMGADILVMAQTEVGELVENAEGGGKSSVMPHKNNPVLSEALVALAKLNSGLHSIQLNSLVHTNERDAAAWILEWKCIPQIVGNTAAGLNHALTISEKIKVNTENMKRNVDLFKKSNKQ
ncbi:3-carboxy-cis,cis-muconate cycloisomerase [Chryseolinea serpens]|uniref:3-carboxy-cis,cis-muconate cycloisomerase n=1 Tax=Chryseolinea serpens TaxID=947013 RepID=A0A1M5TEG9_9BACT|nr:lyase family protein [Chryseolinea serpens]SHH48713.1 3-carboxy-cis,cis-muconate cycloisomerase [Chryseolinea serpens]